MVIVGQQFCQPVLQSPAFAVRQKCADLHAAAPRTEQQPAGPVGWPACPELYPRPRPLKGESDATLVSLTADRALFDHHRRCVDPDVFPGSGAPLYPRDRPVQHGHLQSCKWQDWPEAERHAGNCHAQQDSHQRSVKPGSSAGRQGGIRPKLERIHGRTPSRAAKCYLNSPYGRNLRWPVPYRRLAWGNSCLWPHLTVVPTRDRQAAVSGAGGPACRAVP